MKHSEMAIFLNNSSVPPFSLQTTITQPSKTSLSISYKNNMISSHLPKLLYNIQAPAREYSTSIDSPTVTRHNVTQISEQLCNRSPNTLSKTHKVMLSFTPTFPCHQYRNNFSEDNKSTLLHSSSQGHHVTSVHLQLQPTISYEPFIKLSALRNGSNAEINKQQYSSTVQMSFSPHSTTFSVQRTNISHEKHLCPPMPAVANGEEIVRAQNLSALSVLNNNDKAKSSYINFCIQHLLQHSKPEDYYSSPNRNAELSNSSFQETGYLSSSMKQSEVEGLPRKVPIPHRQPHVQAVIHHQKLRLEILRKEFIRQNSLYVALKKEVDVLEQEIHEHERKKQNRTTMNAVNHVALKKLVEENKELKEECNILLLGTKLFKYEKTRCPESHSCQNDL